MINDRADTSVYLKNSTRKLLLQNMPTSAYYNLLSKTVDMDGAKIPFPPVPYGAVLQHP